jgi:hypothetical protein
MRAPASDPVALDPELPVPPAVEVAALEALEAVAALEPLVTPLEMLIPELAVIAPSG